MGLIASRARTGASAGVQERARPLPAGRYWIDLFPNPEAQACFKACLDQSKLFGPIYYVGCAQVCKQLHGDGGPELFDAWYKANESSVTIEKTEEYAFPNVTQPRTWALFVTTAPLAWDERLGNPNIAPSGVNTSDDTVQKPPPEKGPLDRGGLLDEAKPWLIGGGVLLGLIAVATIVRR